MIKFEKEYLAVQYYAKNAWAWKRKSDGTREMLVNTHIERRNVSSK